MDSVQLLVAGLLVLALINMSVLAWAFYNEKFRKHHMPAPQQNNPVINTPELNLDLSHVEHTAEQQLQEAVEASKDRLQQSINTSIDKVAARIAQVAETTVNQEFEKYKVTLETLQAQSVQEFSKLQLELHAKQEEMMKNLEVQVAAEMETRMDAFNTHLNDVVASYLAESLGNNVDLGAQSMYIMQSLEQHKEDIKRDTLA